MISRAFATALPQGKSTVLEVELTLKQPSYGRDCR